jgi:hypothetical protein
MILSKNKKNKNAVNKNNNKISKFNKKDLINPISNKFRKYNKRENLIKTFIY